jgi:hypothetical protein
VGVNQDQQAGTKQARAPDYRHSSPRLLEPALGFGSVHAERVELRHLMQKSFLW